MAHVRLPAEDGDAHVLYRLYLARLLYKLTHLVVDVGGDNNRTILALGVFERRNQRRERLPCTARTLEDDVAPRIDGVAYT